MIDSVLIKGNLNSIDINIDIPASKSFTQRILACAYICEGVSLIKGAGKSNDELALLQIIRNLGVQVIDNKSYLEVRSNGIFNNSYFSNSINFHESGLAARMMTPVVANLNNSLFLAGTGSLLNRPLNLFDEIFPLLDVQFISNNGYLPFELKGPLLPKSITVPGNLSSQYITGLILAYAASPFLKQQQLIIRNAVSTPYINMTIEVLKHFNVDIEFHDEIIYFNGPYEFKPCEVMVEGDWSSASFFLVAGAILGKCKVNNLNINSSQADIKIIAALKEFGADILIAENTITVTQNKMESFIFDATHCPDLFPALAVLACFGNRPSVIYGLNRLINKESNRAYTIKSELEKMGAIIQLNNDKMEIYPTSNYVGCNINSHNDHRIAMACSIMALKCKGTTTINNANAINKSFPEFYNYLFSNVSN